MTGASSASKPKIVHGGGAFIWPVIQDYAILSLEPFAIDIPLKGALSQEKVRVHVPAAFTLAVSTEEDLRRNAATCLLDMDHEGMESQSKEIIVGQMRRSGTLSFTHTHTHTHRFSPVACTEFFF